MAQLKSTNITGNLAVSGNILASKIIKLGGTASQILMADGSTLDKSSIGSSDTKVTVNPYTDNANYPIVINPSVSGAPNTNTMGFKAGVTINPSTSTITANYFDGFIIGGLLSGTTIGDNATAEGLNTTASGNYSHAEGNYTTSSGESSHAEGDGTTAEGYHSHAEGWYATASGYASHAEGNGTTASGDQSHAEGCGTTASDSCSHAEGENTEASGYTSHAEGYGTTASGESSHAEGIHTNASNDYSHAEGWETTASGTAAHAEGVMTTASGTYSHAEGGSTIASGQYSHVQGKFNIEDTTNTYAHIVGNGSSSARSNAHTLDWDGNAWFKGNVRVGGTSWNDAIELGSGEDYDDTEIRELISAKQDTLVSGTNIKTINSVSILGSGNITITGAGVGWPGTGTGAEKFNYESNEASGDYSHAEGYDAEASNFYSHAEGSSTIASGYASHTEGDNTTASGDGSHAEGSFTVASGDSSHAEGWSTKVTGDSTVTATTTTSTTAGDYGHAEGYGTVAYGTASHAEGNGTMASGPYSHAEGYGTKASGSSSHVEGSTNTASGNCSHAEGYYTKASGNYSHAEGGITTASGGSSHAEGGGTVAYGTYSHAEGYYAEASGNYSHAGGHSTIANHYQHVVGKFNISTAGPTSLSDTTTSAGLFIVGIGTRNSRSNGFRINPAGNVYGVGSFNTSGADYAEYFEWLDGNPNNEDRRGRFVTLDEDKIRYATIDDDYILGVVSAEPSVVGDVHSEEWHNRYLKDIYGNKIVEVVEVEETTDENGEIIPAHTERRWVLNPDYDPNATYVSREERPEWAAVGLMGKLVVVDDGTCQINGYCQPNAGGIATASQEKTNYRVMERLDDTHIRIFIR